MTAALDQFKEKYAGTLVGKCFVLSVIAAAQGWSVRGRNPSDLVYHSDTWVGIKRRIGNCRTGGCRCGDNIVLYMDHVAR